MRRLITRSMVGLVVLTLLAGCGQLWQPKASDSEPAATAEPPPAATTQGGGESPAPRPAEQPAPPAPVVSPVPAASPAPVVPPAPATPAVPTVSLREQLALRPALSVKPGYRWALPPAEEGYLPLPTGLLLTYPRFNQESGTGKPFVITARKTDGRVAWHYDPGITDRQVSHLSLSSWGDRLAVVEWDGRVTVLNTGTGERIATLELTAEEAQGALLTNGGFYVAALSLSSSGWAISGATIYPVDERTLPPHRLTGMALALSPHHDKALVVVPEGIEVKNVFTSRSIMKSNPPQEMPVLHISGDGDAIFLWGDKERLLYVYDRSLKLVGQPTPVANWWDLYFPGYASLYYYDKTAIWLDGRTVTLDYDADAWQTSRVLPKGERVLFAVGQEQVECVVTPTGTLLGCLPWLESHFELSSSFFWTADGESVLAYLL